MLTELQKVAIAKLVDNRGYIGIQPCKDSRRSTMAFAVSLAVITSDRRPLDRLNGWLPRPKSVKCLAWRQRRPLFRLRLVANEAVALLEAVASHTKRKTPQIKLVSELEALRRQLTPPLPKPGVRYFLPMAEPWEEEAEAIFEEFKSLQRNARDRK